jgi:outer membrane protein assembly factor BamD (BamD/ComL family)
MPISIRAYIIPEKQDPISTRFLALAESTLKRHPQTPMKGAVSSRIAELYYLNGRPGKAIEWARRVLKSSRRIQDRADLALYLQGAILRRKGNYMGAEKSLKELSRRFPDSYLVGGAMENLALIYEATGRLGDAVDNYAKLGYESDVAFLLDAKMSTQAVGKYAASKSALFSKPYQDLVKLWDKPPTYSFGEVVKYSYGIRLMRDFKLDEARRVFATLPPTRLQQFALEKDDWWSEANTLRNPLNTIHALQYRMKKIKGAASDEQRALSEYDLAAYIYNKRDLLFYNKPLWEGMREGNFVFYYNTAIAKPADNKALRDHCYEHECLNRARVLFLKIVRKWPNSKVAPKALYTAACATERLSNMNEWWRKEDQRAKLTTQAISLMKELAVKYPKHALAHDAGKYAKVWANPEWTP